MLGIAAGTGLGSLAMTGAGVTRCVAAGVVLPAGVLPAHAARRRRAAPGA
ncbi:hypothetical protein [Saccharothrix espanaensis]|uniref:Putative secreted protein n=1 Tax=Saccharothrix espanaensis (strain ATCC 51144 / DSM 44229 / JCM 9112 / NBRC 15066 / NRRL 15764) TaxID=1179773 RepID=K0JSI8_SACES|nr:hypothetical protein [Saccharothrix espanaensis]CCH28482.1 putative secreted protein [Saccharothrix espanaensis DSM 44229]